MHEPLSTALPAPGAVGPKAWGIPAILAGLALPAVLWGSSLALSLSEGTADNLSDADIATGIIFNIVLQCALIAIAAFLSIGRHKLPRGELGVRGFDRDLWWLAPVAAAGAIVGIALYSGALIGLGLRDATPQQDDLERLFQSRSILPLTAVTILIMAPLSEEIFFRGFMFGGLIRSLGPVGAMLGSGFLFSLFHITGAESVTLVPPFTLIGVLFAWLYYRTGSIYPGLMAHVLFNVVGFAAGAAGG